MLKILVFSLTFCCFLQNVQPSRILAVIPSAAYSHQMFHQQLWRELAIRGHEIVVITTHPTNENLTNFKEISIQEARKPFDQLTKDVVENSLFTMLVNNEYATKQLKIINFIARLPQVQELINNREEHFDLLMIEHFPTLMFGFQHHFKCPMIGVTSLEGFDLGHGIMGNAVHSILYPVPIVDMHQPSIFKRIFAPILLGIINLCLYRNGGPSHKLMKEIFGEDTPPITEIMKKTDMLFVNANPLFNAIRPLSPSTISIAGGIHMKPAMPLPQDVQDFLDSAKNGAIYFSLGSSLKTSEVIEGLGEIIMETLGQLPYKVLWKFEDNSIAGKPDNVKLIKWAPQQDILRHKNIKLFITQGGLQSLEETLYLHVPVVVMPFMADQHMNAAKIKNNGLGLLVDKENLNVEAFKSAIIEVINNPVYKESVKRLAAQIQDTPMTALERAVWWTEYVLRHKGGQHLKGPVIPWYQYYYLDVLSVLVSISLVSFGSLLMIVRCCIKRICSFRYYNLKGAKEHKYKKM